MQIETEGIVLRSTQFSESDAILNVFTKKFGKLGVYVKHARRLKSPLMSSAQVDRTGDLRFDRKSQLIVKCQSDSVL